MCSCYKQARNWSLRLLAASHKLGKTISYATHRIYKHETGQSFRTSPALLADSATESLDPEVGSWAGDGLHGAPPSAWSGPMFTGESMGMIRLSWRTALNGIEFLKKLFNPHTRIIDERERDL